MKKKKKIYKEKKKKISQSCGASRWRVCYQRDYPVYLFKHLVSTRSHCLCIHPGYSLFPRKKCQHTDRLLGVLHLVRRQQGVK